MLLLKVHLADVIDNQLTATVPAGIAGSAHIIGACELEKKRCCVVFRVVYLCCFFVCLCFLLLFFVFYLGFELAENLFVSCFIFFILQFKE